MSLFVLRLQCHVYTKAVFGIRVAMSCMLICPATHILFLCRAKYHWGGWYNTSASGASRCHLIPYLEFDASCSLITRTYIHAPASTRCNYANQPKVYSYTVPAAYILMISLIIGLLVIVYLVLS